MTRRSSVYICAGLICLSAASVHADAAQDLMAALGISSTQTATTNTSTSFDIPTTTIDIAALSATDATTTVATDPATEKEKQVQALRDLVKTLTSRLKALIASKKKAVASLSDSSEICSVKRILKRGMRGDDVKALQKYLVNANILDPQYVSGTFGAITESALQEWQMQNGIASNGSPETTGWGAVGAQTKTLLQQACTTSAKGAYVDPASPKNSNLLPSGTNPQKVRMSLAIDGTSFNRGMKIPIRITIQDPIPYLGADVDFMQVTSKGTNTFGGHIYLPVGFNGQVTHFINASHIDIEAKDKSYGTSEIPINAFIEARFHDTDTGQEITRTFGSSDPVNVYLSEDTINGSLTFSVNGTVGDKSGDIKSDFGKFFAATTTSRANGIEYCDLLSQVVTKGASYSCKWKDEELADIVKTKTRTIPASSSGRTLSSYFMFIRGVISSSDTSLPREEALQNCGRNHSGDPKTPMTCIWDNEIIYDNGGLEDQPQGKYIEPGAAPIAI